MPPFWMVLMKRSSSLGLYVTSISAGYRARPKLAHSLPGPGIVEKEKISNGWTVTLARACDARECLHACNRPAPWKTAFHRGRSSRGRWHTSGPRSELCHRPSQKADRGQVAASARPVSWPSRRNVSCWSGRNESSIPCCTCGRVGCFRFACRTSVGNNRQLLSPLPHDIGGPMPDFKVVSPLTEFSFQIGVFRLSSGAAFGNAAVIIGGASAGRYVGSKYKSSQNCRREARERGQRRRPHGPFGR